MKRFVFCYSIANQSINQNQRAGYLYGAIITMNKLATDCNIETYSKTT